MWMHIEHIGLSEINQRQTLYFITYVWSLKNKNMNMRKWKQAHRYRELVVTSGKKEGGGAI